VPIEFELRNPNKPMSGLRFKQVEILEVSLTSVPANSDAMVVGKSLSGRADRIRRAAQLRVGRDAGGTSTGTGGVSTLSFGGTLADRKWQADRANRQSHDRAERALHLALAAADSSTLAGRRAIARAHRRYHERMVR